MLKYRGAIITIALITALWLVYFSQQLIHADQRNYGGDGFKNYFTVAYYLQHDKGSHFSGMNYPYGENVSFTDNQPALVWLLKPIVTVFPELAGHIKMILQLLIFLSIIFSALLTYLTLRLLLMGEVCAIIFAMLITLMAPQIMRLSGHFALAYTSFFPLVIYLLVKAFQNQNNKWPLLWLTLTLTFFAFIHPYYLAMAGMYILIIALLFVWLKRIDFKASFRFIILLISSVVIPFIILEAYFLITDHIADRPATPWGFINSCTTIPDIILNADSFTGQGISKLFPAWRIPYHPEGTGYIGLVSVITLLVAAIVAIIRKIKGTKTESPFLQYPLNLFFPASVVVLLFAMAVPFCFSPFEKYYDLLPAAVKQFRASGRFNWVFYYTATLVVALLIYQLYNWLVVKHKVVAMPLLVIILTIWFVEDNMISNNHFKHFNNWVVKLDEKKEQQKFDSIMIQSAHRPSDFQAILPLPFFLNGSEKLYISSYSEFHAMHTAMLSGLPIVCGEMSRTSLSQTLKIADLVSSEYLVKNVLKDYPNQKPLLLITVENNFSPEEWKLINQAKLLFVTKNVKYYELPLSAFNNMTADIKDFFVKENAHLFKHDGYLSTDSTNNAVVNGFEAATADNIMIGKGAHYNQNGETILYNSPLPSATINTDYEFSIWLYSDKNVPAYPALTVYQIDSTGKKYDSLSCEGKFSTNTFEQWVRVQRNFKLRNVNDTIRITGHGDYATYDELMIRPLQLKIISSFVADSSFSYNNFPIR